LLTDTNISKLLGKEIVIDPFDEDGLTSIGYDLSVGEFVYSLSRGLLTPNKRGLYKIWPGESILVLTKEFLWVSDQIGGTFHSKVSMVSQGYSHISTTLDPLWSGPLLIATSNRSSHNLTLSKGQKFVTIVFYRTVSRATRPHKKPPARSDILIHLLTNPADAASKEFFRNQRQLAEKVSQTLKSVEAQTIFKEKVKAASEASFNKVLHAMKLQWRSKGLYYLYIILHLIFLLLFILLPVYFDSFIKITFPNVFSNVSVDSEFFAATFGAIVVVLLSLINLLRKN
jgi:deoxycytidine triphosphate deaminase